MKTKILGQSKLDSIFGAAGYAACSKVSSLSFFEDSQSTETSYSIILALETDRLDDNYRLRMRFTGVQDLKIREFGARPTQITGFDVIDIGDRQLEGMNFEVTDYENGVIHFFCKTASVDDIERIDAAS